MDRKNSSGGNKTFRASFVTGAVALVFLIIGFQMALFIHRSAVLKILSNRDRPDTVFVIDSALAARLLASRSAQDMKSVAGGARPGGAPKLSGGHVIVRKDSEHAPPVEGLRAVYPSRNVESFPFDPNTVSVEDLVRLGFSEKQARAIDNYRMKGGRFRRRSDFAESYVVADSVYRRLEKYIDIPLLDLNLADSAALDALPGIGGYYASRIIEFRKRLGGSFSYKEQLMDIRNFDRERFDGLADLVTVDSVHVRPYPLWTLPEDSLRQHPYIRYSQVAHGIVIFRENNPRSDWTVLALEKAGVLSPEMASRLSRCRIEGARP